MQHSVELVCSDYTQAVPTNADPYLLILSQVLFQELKDNVKSKHINTAKCKIVSIQLPKYIPILVLGAKTEDNTKLVLVLVPISVGMYLACICHVLNFGVAVGFPVQRTSVDKSSIFWCVLVCSLQLIIVMYWFQVGVDLKFQAHILVSIEDIEYVFDM